MNYTYDKLNRVTNRTVTNGAAYATQFGYVQGASAYGSNATTPLISSITQGSGANAQNFSYTYDSRGNITSETRNGITTTYEYDALGQLTRVNDPNDPTAHNEGALSDNGTTWIYVYDRGGNILSKTAYDYTTGAVGTAVRTWLYEYNDTNWKDKLTKFDGNTITYDEIVNPLNDGTWTYLWQAGRQLKSMSKVEGSNTVTMEFTYNHAGLRTQKVKKVNGTVTETTEYILNGKNIVELIHTNHDTSGVNRLHFYYDAQGRVALVDFNGTLYSYAHNLQGDIIGILDTSGNIVVEYKYYAWGKPVNITGALITTLGKLNPFKDRGYVWDEETDQYYLRNRYYNIEKNRFICPDKRIEFGGNAVSENMFAYCCNNPITFMDGDGFGKIYVYYYYFQESKQPLKNEAVNSPYFDFYDKENVVPIQVRSSAEFIKKWNEEMADEVEAVYLYLHGGAGYLQFDYDKISIDDSADYSLSELNYKTIQDGKYIFSCYAAASNSQHESVAGFLSQSMKTDVLACDTGVSFRRKIDAFFGINDWHARTCTEDEDGNHWFAFLYYPMANKVYECSLTFSKYIGENIRSLVDCLPGILIA